MSGALDLLHLEDCEDDAALVRRTLAKGGIEANLQVVQTEEAFLEALKEKAWAVILSDYNLPGTTGGRALRALRERDGETPFILVSGEIGEELAADLMRRGASDFIRKDHLERLVPVVQRELREAAVRREHREAKDRLMRLGQAVEQSGDEVVLADAGGRILHINAAFTACTGYSLQEALGRSPLDLLGDPMDAALHQEMLDAIRREGRWLGRFPARTRDGAVVLLDSRITVLRDADGGMAGFIGTHRDVTRQVEMESHLEQSQRLEAIGTLAGGIAHDFNNMLMAIRGFAEAARLRNGDPALAPSLAGILKATDRAKELVQQILAFSRTAPSERRPVEARAVLVEALKFLRATLPASILLEQRIASGASVLADPTELQRIILNLCTNGMQAMPGAVGTLAVGLDEESLDDGPRPAHPALGPGRYLRLRVADTGRGMSPEVQARVFEPFFTTREGKGGTGMGLAVVHGLVTSMGGSIAVESSPGEGSTFEVLLPAREAPAPPQAVPLPGLASGRGRILFVDDEAVLCGLAQEMLGHMGYQATVLTDPLEALRRLEGNPFAFDLVMTDLSMPGLTGDRLARRVAELRPGLPVVLCTGFLEDMDKVAADGAGITRFVEKPFEWTAMSRILQACLEGSPAGTT